MKLAKRAPSMMDFVQDDDLDPANVSKLLRRITGYDPSRYKDEDEDDRNMVASFNEVRRPFSSPPYPARSAPGGSDITSLVFTGLPLLVTARMHTPPQRRVVVCFHFLRYVVRLAPLAKMARTQHHTQETGGGGDSMEIASLT
eukprot:4948698-Pyramimonas_sp.AAC.2